MKTVPADTVLNLIQVSEALATKQAATIAELERNQSAQKAATAVMADDVISKLVASGHLRADQVPHAKAAMAHPPSAIEMLGTLVSAQPIQQAPASIGTAKKASIKHQDSETKRAIEKADATFYGQG